MNEKQIALALLRTRALTYFQARDAARDDHAALVQAIKNARDAGATQREATEACNIADHRKFSRQRIDQLEKST